MVVELFEWVAEHLIDDDPILRIPLALEFLDEVELHTPKKVVLTSVRLAPHLDSQNLEALSD